MWTVQNMVYLNLIEPSKKIVSSNVWADVHHLVSVQVLKVNFDRPIKTYLNEHNFIWL